MDWGKLWEADGKSRDDFWWDLATKYVSISGFNTNGFANELIQLVIERVIVPDVDPHPETYGQYVLKRSFADVLGWQALDRHIVTYNANGGSGSMASETVLGVDGLPVYTNIRPLAFSPATGYYFTGWNTAADGSGIPCTAEQFIGGIPADITLYAQWSNLYTLTVDNSYRSDIASSRDTGPMEYYALWIDGAEQPDLGAFSNSARTYTLPYGTPVGVIAQTKDSHNGADLSRVTFNGTKVAGDSTDARYTFTLTGNTSINFEWTYYLHHDGGLKFSYTNRWNCYITTN